MNWYFDNDGAADGPHDEPAMAALVAQGRISPQTLVWQTSMPAWKDAILVDAPWWKGETAGAISEVPVSAAVPLAEVPPPPRPATETRRRPIVAAPTGALIPPPQPAPPKRGFFARLFGRR